LQAGGLLSPAQGGAYIAFEQAKCRPIVVATGTRLE